MKKSPRIGITTSLEDGRQTLDTRYVEAVEAAGGLPVILPLLKTAEAAAEFAALLDGLIISGGPGITRGLIGALPADLPPVDTRRDLSDELICRALDKRPMLGICYGMQFVNALAGGGIYGDAQAQAEALVHSADRGASQHEIRISANSRLHAVLKTKKLMTNTHHIQAVADLGGGLRVTARAADGVIEALESEDGRIVGVQFHPERMTGAARALFADLVERASCEGYGR
ncbi:MAG: gamma-glutamyl-gamma-aminobutyrate hydrolase family protein [Chloroflexota bacterium]|nr:gamma-glutamyl-gamma-aminobutyrate hydrolase family protein [Chloroflexota bacterium]MDE2949896.1 gamma-glutamyl-gamma-aminobutyrate hydrolase family protein [Chloroflexota bacterium]